MTSSDRDGREPGPPEVPTGLPGAEERGAAAALLARPDLWGTGLRVLVGHIRRRWWARPPFLPLPDPSHLAWRRLTLYGSADRPLAPSDLVGYLEWCRRQRRARR